MKTRTIEAQLLRQAIKQRGEGGLAELARATHVSVSWLQKAVTGNYQGEPRNITREALCRETGFSEDVLFPFAVTKEKRRTG